MTDTLPSTDATTVKHAGTPPASTADRPSPTAAPLTERFRWALLLLTLTASFMTALDVFIVNVALPSMQRDLHTGAATVQWVVAGFGLAVGAGVITGGQPRMRGSRQPWARPPSLRPFTVVHDGGAAKTMTVQTSPGRNRTMAATTRSGAGVRRARPHRSLIVY